MNNEATNEGRKEATNEGSKQRTQPNELRSFATATTKVDSLERRTKKGFGSQSSPSTPTAKVTAHCPQPRSLPTARSVTHPLTHCDCHSLISDFRFQISKLNLLTMPFTFMHFANGCNMVLYASNVGKLSYEVDRGCPALRQALSLTSKYR